MSLPLIQRACTVSPIVNVHEVQVHPLPAPYAPTGRAAETHAPLLARLAGIPGSPQLGANLVALAPGKCAFPFHSHRVSDELFYIVSGAGELRFGEHIHPLREGDFIACHAGGPEAAHQIRNTGASELRYIAIGTNPPADIAEYPDSGKFKTYSLGDGTSRFDATAKMDEDSSDYWSLADG